MSEAPEAAPADGITAAAAASAAMPVSMPVSRAGRAVWFFTTLLVFMTWDHPKKINWAMMLICLFFVLFCSVGIYFEDQVSPGVHFFLLPGA